jgi:hypothetical protein
MEMKKMTKYINTMRDLEMATYGGGSNGNLLKAAGVVGSINSGFVGSSGDALTLNGTAASNLTALYNMVYGQKVWAMINQEINPLAILPKRPYTSSGWRVMTARPQGGSGAAFSVNTTTGNAQGNASPDGDLIGGVGENEALDSTQLEAMAPEYATLYMNPKIVAHMFDYSELASEMAKIDDGIGDLRKLIREDMGKHHAESQSKMLVMPLEVYDSLGADTSSGRIRENYTSLMKIVSSFTELSDTVGIHNVSALGGTTNYATTDDDAKILYGATRSAASYLDAEVNFGGSYATAGRQFTLSTINSTIQSLRLNGGTPKVILTGYDTIQALSDLLQSQERFMDSKEVMPTHNGVKGVKGAEVGFRVATYYDIPLIPAKDMPTTGGYTGTKLSDMLLLDTDHLWFATMKPTQYFEDGISHGNPFGVGVLGNRGLYRTMGETGCTFFKGQGKITNLF